MIKLDSVLRIKFKATIQCTLKSSPPPPQNMLPVVLPYGIVECRIEFFANPTSDPLFFFWWVPSPFPRFFFFFLRLLLPLSRRSLSRGTARYTRPAPHRTYLPNVCVFTFVVSILTAKSPASCRLPLHHFPTPATNPKPPPPLQHILPFLPTKKNNASSRSIVF